MATTRLLGTDFFAQVQTFLCRYNVFCTSTDFFVRHQLASTSGEWQDYESPIPDQLIPSPSVIWVRKGETDTVAALDKIVKEWHRSGFLIDEGNKWHMPPSQQLLAWHREHSSK
jgi:polar amino acid transport system substrate-binding protein